jgi:hypothetical protein
MKCLIEDSKGATELDNSYLGLYIIDVIKRKSLCSIPNYCLNNV